MIQGVTFASCYVYSPRGASAASERSRLLRALLKGSDAYFLDKYADRVRHEVAEGPSLAGYFRATSILIPIPGCAPRSRGSMSVTESLAGALQAEGLGQSVWAGLRRTIRVRKSATAAPGSRPTVGNHYDSLAVVASSGRAPGVSAAPDHLVLVDDVVTKGRTLLAAAARLREAFPLADIRAFALIRTLGRIADVEQLLQPCVGEISWRSGDARRVP